ncbi:MAG TPA: hypothetical protein DCR21_04130 [Succinivibrionaceae bacterium]|nr:hypothetical protein [Succinivibrionaceae bacterium]
MTEQIKKHRSIIRQFKGFRFFLGVMLVTFNLLILWMLYSAHSALARDYARAQQEIGTLRVLAGIDAVSSEADAATRERLDNYKSYMLKRFDDTHAIAPHSLKNKTANSAPADTNSENHNGTAN